MAVLDLEQLLVPVSETSPSGPNLEYDPAFAALERASQGKPEQVMGGVTTPAEPPEWGAVIEKGVALLGHTKDLRIAVLVTRALLHREGMAAFVEGLGLIRGMLEQFWDSLHPQLDPDDDNDPTMRISALTAITIPPVVVALRTAPLVDSRALGSVSLADMVPAEGTPDNARIQGVFAHAELPALEASVAALSAGSANLRAIDAVFEAQGSLDKPDLGPLLQYFHQARQAVEPRVADRRPSADVVAPAADQHAAPAQAAPTLEARALTGDILSREDVVRALDKISVYYQRYEPSSPVPLVLERCKKLVTMGFLEIMTELAPDALRQVELVTGTRSASEAGE